MYSIFSDACSIELVDTVVVTGGSVGSLVQVYTTAGHLERLPDLITARYHHACAHYVDSQDRVVSIAYNITAHPTLVTLH